METILMSWSGGKDSALALHEIRKDKELRVAALLTTLTEGYDRISMHGVRRALLEQQAAALGLPLEKIYISQNASNDEYEANMAQVLARYKALGVTAVAFGDIFLEDLRRYREQKLASLELKALFPLWKKDTLALAHSLTAQGFKATVTCVDTTLLPAAFAGRVIDDQFLSELPPGIDPCGENGEFHSFVSEGPLFTQKIACTLGEIVLRDHRFCFADLIPA